MDLAKFAGISLVVFDHVVKGISNSGIEPTALVSGIHQIISSFHVPLFFVIAGLFFPAKYSSQSFLPFTLKRWDRLVYLCILWSILQATAQILFSGLTNHHHSLSDILSISFFTNPQGQFWFLYALFSVTAASAAIYRLGGNAYVVLAVAAIMILVADRFDGVVSLTFAHWIYFAIGTCISPVLHDHGDVFCRKPVIGLVIALFALVQSCAMVITGDNPTTPGCVLTVAMAVSGSLFVLMTCLNMRSVRLTSLGYLGRHSMEILLMHILAAAGMRIALVRIFGFQDLFVLMVACTVAGILLPILAAFVLRTLRMDFFLSCPEWLSLSKRIAE